MKYSSSTLFAAMLAMAPFTANAHMLLASPVPYGTPDNGPLKPDGTDFPCKKLAYDASAAKAKWAVGSQVPISFSGTAIHGGGSCQISVTTDKPPTAQSKWKVIYSMEGGCPASPKAGGNFVAGDVLATYNITVPPEVPNGDQIMAWTWFNKVGNREFYMNCASVSVTGGAETADAFNKLPDMAVANIPSINSCQTKEGVDYIFENPGKYTNKGDGPGKLNFAPLCASGSTGGNAGSGNTQPQPQQPQQSQKPQSSQQPQQPAIASKGSPSDGTAVTSTIRTIVTVTASSGPAPTPKNGTAPSPKSPSAPESAPVPSQAPTTGGTVDGSSCSPDGAVVCNGSDKFAICNRGKAVWQNVAQGTTCKDGKVLRRDNADYATTMVRLVRPPRVRPEFV